MGKSFGSEKQVTWIPLCTVTLRTYSLRSSSDGITSSIIDAAFKIPLVIFEAAHKIYHLVIETDWSVNQVSLLADLDGYLRLEAPLLLHGFLVFVVTQVLQS